MLGSRITGHLEKKIPDKDKSVHVQFAIAGNTCSVGFKCEDLYGQGKVSPVIGEEASKGFNLKRIAIRQIIRYL